MTQQSWRGGGGKEGKESAKRETASFSPTDWRAVRQTSASVVYFRMGGTNVQSADLIFVGNYVNLRNPVFRLFCLLLLKISTQIIHQRTVLQRTVLTPEQILVQKSKFNSNFSCWPTFNSWPRANTPRAPVTHYRESRLNNNFNYGSAAHSVFFSIKGWK